MGAWIAESVTPRPAPSGARGDRRHHRDSRRVGAASAAGDTALPVHPGQELRYARAMAPCLLDTREADLRAISVETRVSGDVMQTATTELLIFPIVDLIVYLSQGKTLEPGDIIATGAPGGGSRVPPRYLRQGDVVEVTVSGVGTLRNPVHFEGR